MSLVVMYHYIRKYDKKIKNLNFLHQNSFLKQLDYFNKNFKFYKLSENIEQLDKNKKKILLTFDDGLKEHLQVAKWLEKKVPAFLRGSGRAARCRGKGGLCKSRRGR